MSRRLARAALALYPLAYRCRYGAEMEALLEDAPPGARAVADLLRGALVAQLHPVAGISSAISVEDRLRASASGVLACWVAFAAAGFGFYKTTEDHPFSVAGDAHPVLGGTHLAIQLLAVLASIAVLAGALPLVYAALRQARHNQAVRRSAAAALASVAVFAILTAAAVALAHSAHSLPDGVRVATFVVWSLAGLACGASCALAARRGVFSIAASPRALTAALALGTLVTGAMAAISIATAVYSAGMGIDAAGLASQGNGPSGMLSVEASLAIQLAIMVVAAGLATVTTKRGWAALRSRPAQ